MDRTARPSSRSFRLFAADSAFRDIGTRKRRPAGGTRYVELLGAAATKNEALAMSRYTTPEAVEVHKPEKGIPAIQPVDFGVVTVVCVDPVLPMGQSAFTRPPFGVPRPPAWRALLLFFQCSLILTLIPRSVGMHRWDPSQPT